MSNIGQSETIFFAAMQVIQIIVANANTGMKAINSFCIIVNLVTTAGRKVQCAT